MSTGLSHAERDQQAAALASVRCCVLCGTPRFEMVGVYMPGPEVQAALRPDGGRPVGMTYGLCRGCYGVPGVLDRVARALERPASLAEYMDWMPPAGKAVADEPRTQSHAPGRPRLPRRRVRPAAARRQGADHLRLVVE